MQLRPPVDSEAIISNARRIGPLIEEEADKFAKERRLTDDAIALMRRAGLFRIAFPKAWGGPEMDILSQCEVMETLGYHDASAAWVAMICSDSGHYAARIDETEARALYPSLDLLTSGAIAPMGQAHIVDGGLKVSGRWTFGSGCLHADRLVAGCVLLENGKPLIGPGGRPEFLAVWLPKDKVQIHDTWYTTGLAGSGSNDYSVQDVVVRRALSFHPFRAGTRLEPLYRYQGFFIANMPSVALGCARRMINDFRELAERKIAPPALTPLKNEYRAQVALAEATTRLGAARAYQHSSLSSIWQTVSRDETPSAAQRAAVGMMAIHGLQEALKVGEIVCEAAGSAALYASSPFDRRRRDLITMSNHIMGQHKTRATMGQLLFGDEVVMTPV
jgi:alkylation response protein AidB-like acyl-CoA dehydrogenase